MRKQLIVFGIVIATLIIGIAIYNSFTLKLVSTNPSQGSAQHPYYQPVTFTYNQALSQDKKPTITVDPEIEGEVVIIGKTLTFKPSAFWDIDTYTIKVQNAEGSRGFNLKESTLTFTTKSVAPDDLPKDIRDKQPPDAEPPAQFQDDIVDE